VCVCVGGGAAFLLLLEFVHALLKGSISLGCFRLFWEMNELEALVALVRSL